MSRWRGEPEGGRPGGRPRRGDPSFALPLRVRPLGPFGVLDRFLVSRSHSGAVRYVVESLAVAHGRRRRFRLSLARRLEAVGLGGVGPGVGPGFGALIRQLPSPSDLPSRFHRPLELLDAFLERRLEESSGLAVLGGDRPAGFVLLAGYRDQPPGRSVIFLFAAGEGAPRAVLKLQPQGASGEDGGGGEEGGFPAREAAAREAVALERLASLPPPLAATVPRCLGLERFPDRRGGCDALLTTALLTTVLPGRSAYVELHRGLTPAARASDHLEPAGRWLGLFQRATRTGQPWRPPEPDDPLFGPVRGEGGAAPGWLLRMIRGLDRTPLAASAGHGDFWARNLLIPPGDGGDGGAAALPGVVDWEGYRPVAPPWEDLFHFAWSYAREHPEGRGWSRRLVPGQCRRPDPEETLRRAFLEDRPLTRALRRYFEAYTVAAGVPWGLLEPWLRLFLLTRAAAGGEGAGHSAGKEGSWLRAYRRLDAAPRSVFSG